MKLTLILLALILPPFISPNASLVGFFRNIFWKTRFISIDNDFYEVKKHIIRDVYYYKSLSQQGEVGWYLYKFNNNKGKELWNKKMNG